MASVNKFIGIGNLCRDPEKSFTKNGNTLCKITLAVNHRQKNQTSGQWVDHPFFIDCLAWGKQAETLFQFTSKGRSIYVEGRLEQEKWTGKDGNPRSRVVCVVSNFQFLSKPAGAYDKEPEPSSEPSAPPQEIMETPPEGDRHIDYDEIPY